MSHKHDRMLQAVMQGPVSGNLHWREVESLLHHLGAAVEPLQGARVRVKLHGVEGVLHHPHHGNVLTKQAVRQLRGFLTSAGVGPAGPHRSD